MFVDVPDTSELRQGDIIKGLFYPILEYKDFRLVGTPLEDSPDGGSTVNLSAISETKHGNVHFDAHVKVINGYSIILSQCCDLELQNGKLQAHSFVISPLISIPHQVKTSPEKLQLLQANTYNDFVNYFYIAQHPPLPDAFAVDFGRLVSATRHSYEYVLRNKVLQMTDADRIRLKIKFSQHFGRPTKEELESGLYGPDR